jgi:hypothetical protein
MPRGGSEERMAVLTRQSVLGEEFSDLFAEAAPAAALPAADREALCARLIANLRSQLGLYRTYQAQARRQRQALVNRHLAENLGANGEIERLLFELSGLEEERIACTDKLVGPRAQAVGAASAKAAGPEAARAAAAKCEDIYPLVSPASAARLKECRDALAEAVADLKGILAVNQALIENGSKIIHTTIGILTSVAGRTKGDRMGVYTAKGAVNYGKVQIRNLVNRSV